MKILAQPESYSDMLQRVFITTLVTGVICTLILADASPALKTVLDSVTTEADFGPIKKVKALYVVIPMLIALFSRVIMLHDRISDAFRIRHVFDTHFILAPLASGVGLAVTKDLKKKLSKNRRKAMYTCFYPYASFRDPKIDRQLVLSSADRWGWYWVFTESSFLFAVTAVILLIVGKYGHARACAVPILVELTLALFMGFACRRNAQSQVDAILADHDRANSVASELQIL